MEQTKLLAVAMAEKCRSLLQQTSGIQTQLPRPVQIEHLCWMCDQIESHAEEWPAIRLHRWIGYIQCGMVTNRLLDLNAAKTMFQEAKKAHGDISDDLDLIDHLDPDHNFGMELGGQG